MSGYKKERNLFYHLIIWISWIKVFLLIKKVEKQFLKMMVPQAVELVGVKAMLHKKDIDFRPKSKTPRKISLSSSSDDGDDGDSKGVVALVGVVEELVALVRVLEEMVVVMLVK